MIQSQVGKCLEDDSKYLDLSKLGIVALGKLDGGQFIQILNLSQNYLQDILNIGIYTNLWKLDLSHNKLKSLTGLVNFIVIGALNLSYNQLTWPELLKLRHIHILDLTLHGNPHLVKDMYYQIHIIDCLPNCWMLDGKLITSADHYQVDQFFIQSEKLKQPVRHKLPKTNYFPSYLKNVQVCGTFGPRAAHILSTVPLNIPTNIEIDKKRLQYLAFNMQEIISIENPKCEFINNHTDFLKQLLKLRIINREQNNVLFLLLLASLEFNIPSQTIVEMLSVTNLHKCGDILTIDLFLLPREIRGVTVGLLFNAIKLDREENLEAGVYKELFLHLNTNVPDLLKSTTTKTFKGYELPKTECYKDYRFLLAAEICQVLMLVPSFYHYLKLQNSGLFCIMFEATNQEDIQEIVNSFLECQISDKIKDNDNVPEEDQEVNATFGTVAGTWQRELSERLAAMIQDRLKAVTSKEPLLTASEEILYLKPFNQKTFQRHCAQKQIINKSQGSVLSINNHKPRIGESVILGKLIYGKIIALPSFHTAKVYIDGVLEPGGSVIKRVKDRWKHYKTINLKNMNWDTYGKCWRWKMPNDTCIEPVFMEPQSILHVKASQSEERRDVSTTPVKCMSAKSAAGRSLSYITQPNLKENSFYLYCTDQNQEEQIQSSPRSELGFDPQEVKVIMNLDSVSDRISEEDLRRTNSGFENYVLDLKARSTKRGYPESELLVLHLEESKRPHSAIPLQITKIEMEKESKQHYFQKKYPLLARTNDIFSKCITKIPASPQMSSRNNSTTDVRPESCLSGGDASCREKATEISDETVAGDMANHLQINVEQKQQEQIKSVRPKSSQDYPELKNYLQIVRGEKWLANGRNLFEERKQNNSKRFNDLPGSKQTWEFTKTPPHSFNFKCHTPSPTYKSTRPNSSYTPSKKSTLNTISAVPLNIQQYANSSPNKKILQKQRAWSANMCFEKKREKRDYRDQEDRKYNCKFAHNPNNLCLENQRLEFSSVPPSCLQHTPKTPIPSPTNLRKK